MAGSQLHVTTRIYGINYCGMFYVTWCGPTQGWSLSPGSAVLNTRHRASWPFYSGMWFMQSGISLNDDCCLFSYSIGGVLHVIGDDGRRENLEASNEKPHGSIQAPWQQQRIYEFLRVTFVWTNPRMTSKRWVTCAWHPAQRLVAVLCACVSCVRWNKWLLSGLYIVSRILPVIRDEGHKNDVISNGITSGWIQATC